MPKRCAATTPRPQRLVWWPFQKQKPRLFSESGLSMFGVPKAFRCYSGFSGYNPQFTVINCSQRQTARSSVPGANKGDGANLE